MEMTRLNDQRRMWKYIIFSLNYSLQRRERG